MMNGQGITGHAGLCKGGGVADWLRHWTRPGSGGSRFESQFTQQPSPPLPLSPCCLMVVIELSVWSFG